MEHGNQMKMVDRHRYRHGGHRMAVLERDGWKCCLCQMTNAEHLTLFGRRLTVDHKDGQGRNAPVKNHALNNLWTLCMPCHGRKDGPRLFTQEQIRTIRTTYQEGKTSYAILAKHYGVSKMCIYKIIHLKSYNQEAAT